MDLSNPLPPRFRSKADRVIYLLDRFRIPIVVLLGLGGILIVTGGIPRWIEVLLLGVVYGAVPAYAVGRYLVSKLVPDTRREVIELDLVAGEKSGIKARSWQVPAEVWEERDQGDRPVLKPDEGAEAVVSRFEHLDDVGKISVEGCNEELANPVSIVARDSKLEEIEENLIEKAEERDRLEATVRSKALDIQQNNVHALLGAVEQGTQMDPAAVEDAIEDMGMDPSVSGPEDDDDSRDYSFVSRGSPPGETGRSESETGQPQRDPPEVGFEL